MRVHFENAKRLYHEQAPAAAGAAAPGRAWRTTASGPPRTAEIAARLQRFDNDDRLVKTLLLSALVPEVEPLQEHDRLRLAALNHGTIKVAASRAGRHQVVAAASAQLGRPGRRDPRRRGADRPDDLDPARRAWTPRRSWRRPGSTTTPATASPQDPRAAVRVAGHRRRTTRCSSAYPFVWRGSRRRCDVLFANVRELPDESLQAQGDDWKVVIDFPFDDPGPRPRRGPRQARRLPGQERPTRTLVWLPSFFSLRTQARAGQAGRSSTTCCGATTSTSTPSTSRSRTGSRPG